MDSEEFQKELLAKLAKQRGTNKPDPQRQRLKKLCRLAQSWPICFEEQLKDRPIEDIIVCAEFLVAYRAAYISGDPVALPEAVKCSREFQFEMPLWVQKIFEDACDDYLNNEGATDITRFLGLTRGAGNGNNPIVKEKRKQEVAHIVGEMQTLHHGLGFQLSVARRILIEKGVLYPDYFREYQPAYLTDSKIGELWDKSEKLSQKEIYLLYGDSADEKLNIFLSDYADSFHAVYDNEQALDDHKERNSAFRSLKVLTQAALDEYEPPIVLTT